MLYAASCWHILPSSLNLVGDFENFVYEAELQTGPCILRLSHCSHRGEGDLHAELDFIRFLASRELRVCKSSSSVHGRDVEPVGPQFFACCFERADGNRVSARDPALWNARMFRNWGRMLAHFHTSASDYAPPARGPRRFRWDQDDFTTGQYLSSEDSDIRARLSSLLEQLTTLPTSPERYGLIHADLHYGNFFCTADAKLAVFDFDDAAYHWFAYDLAVAINALPTSLSPLEKDRVAREILAGYGQVRAVSPAFDEEVRLLLLLRDIQLYQLVHKKTAPADRDAHWLTRATTLSRRIRAGTPAWEPSR